ncbi:MAG: TIGR04283 family arsenosugar biosynthesis glycosyltransferase [Thermodesulfobacteriota bacterium]
MFSFIIPTYNESSTIEDTLRNLISIISVDDEIIVVDGMSEDDTVQKAKTFPSVILMESDKRGRACQMNLGARKGTGDYIFFLHADTTIDKAGIEKLRYEIINNKILWGWFKLKLNSPKFIYRVLETLACYRTIIAREPLGDHGIFLKKSLFEEVGGYPEIPIMEDVELVKRVKKKSPGKKIDHFVLSSVRRFEREGILRNCMKICIMRVKYFIGYSSKDLSKGYLDYR